MKKKSSVIILVASLYMGLPVHAQSSHVDCGSITAADLDHEASKIADKLDDKLSCADGIQVLGSGQPVIDVDDKDSLFQARCEMINALLSKHVTR